MDPDDSWLGLGILLISLVLLALVSMAQGGLRALPWEGRDPRPKPGGLTGILLWLHQRSEWFFTSALIFTTALIAVGWANFLWMEISPNAAWFWVILAGLGAILLLSLVQHLFYRIGFRAPLGVLLILSPLALAITVILAPFTFVIHQLSQGLMGVLRLGDSDPFSEETIPRTPEGPEGDLTIQPLTKLKETMAREIMVPRIDIVAVEEDAPMSHVLDMAAERGYSRIPVYRETIDNVVGVLYVKDLLQVLRTSNPAPPISSLARPPHFIPESMKISDLMAEFRQQKVHMAIVVDEYGGTAGLVTIEDLLEEIVGEIEDEYDREEVQIERISDWEYVIDARLDVDEFNELLGLDIQKEDFDTIGGFLYARLGRIPTPGDEVCVDGHNITVLSTSGQRIRKVRVTIDPDLSSSSIRESPRS
ncbi:MAG: hypothetical protein HW403_1199 [Dehalococcoidia bacterium]|nr:hypothetical protein [Dehalococcoidia bacterium]